MKLSNQKLPSTKKKIKPLTQWSQFLEKHYSHRKVLPDNDHKPNLKSFPSYKEELANTDVIPQDVQGLPLASLLENLERNFNDRSAAPSGSAFRSEKGPCLISRSFDLKKSQILQGNYGGPDKHSPPD
jgi:hypothetical protein